MPINTSMGAHKLEVRKGDRNHILDFTAPMNEATKADAWAGRCVHLATDGTLVAGLALGKLAYFAWSGTDENNSPDVTRDRGMPYAGEARFGSISVHAACELSTTEFVANAGLIPGAKLTALSNTAALGLKGKLKLAGATDVVVGVVAPLGVYTSPDGYASLAFYPCWVDGTSVPNA